MTAKRAVLGTVLAVLLPVPLVLLLLGSRGWMLPRYGAAERDGVVPILSHEQRKNLVTYHRDCERGTDCETPLACVTDPRVWVGYCTDSQCMSDAQCPEGQVCRSVASTEGRPLVRYCIPKGVRHEGERCVSLPSNREEACAEGLLCGGNQGWCGRACRRGEPGTCPDGFHCADVMPEPLCLPSCETRGCVEGQQCIRFDEGVSACATVYGRQCQLEGACPADSECKVLDSLSRPGSVWMDCVQKCGEDRPTCPSGSVCYMWRCQSSCDPRVPGACGEGFRCEQLKPDKPWVCRPEW